jgi:serine phosphatase RsbU (regulator of sigma subunit)
LFKYLTILLLSVTLSPLFAQKRVRIDSLITASLVAADTTRIKILVELCWAYRNSSIDTAILYGERALEQSLKLNYKTTLPKNYTYLGVLNRNMGNYPKALEYYFLSAKHSEEQKDYEQLGYALQSIGDINNRQGDYEEAIKYTEQGLKQFEIIKDNGGKGYCYYTLGNIYSNKNEYQKAIDFHQKALEIRKHIDDKGKIASSLGVLASIFYKQKRVDDAMSYSTQAKNLFKEVRDLRGIANMTNQIAQIDYDNKNYESAIIKSHEALEIAQKSGNIEYMKDSYSLLHKAYLAQNKLQQAYDNQQLYLVYQDSLFNQERGRQTIALEGKYEQEKRKILVQTLEEEEETQKYTRYAISLVAFIAVLLLIFYIRTFIKRKRTTALLNEQAEEIITKTEQLALTLQDIQQKNEKINDSISYALRIQSAMLLSENHLRDYIPESFIFFKPRDVVSGDFYWFAEKQMGKNKKFIIAVADCTGHGVPGAFMSMIGDALLNEIVHDKEIQQPHYILNQLNEGIRKALHQEATEQNDGMDISVVNINYFDNQLTKIIFAGAMNPAYLVENLHQKPIIHVLKADKQPIGGNKDIYQRKKQQTDNSIAFSFSRQTIIVQDSSVANNDDSSTQTVFTSEALQNKLQNTLENEVVKLNSVESVQTPFMLYMCSDGYQDQFGGKDNRKFMTTKLRNVLTEIAPLPIDEQKYILTKNFFDWKNNQKQTDDVTVIGMRL